MDLTTQTGSWMCTLAARKPFFTKGRLWLQNCPGQPIRRQDGVAENARGRTEGGLTSRKGTQGRGAWNHGVLVQSHRRGHRGTRGPPDLRAACWTPLSPAPRRPPRSVGRTVYTRRPHIYGNSRPMHTHTRVLCILAESVACLTKNQIRTRMRPRETRLSSRLIMERFRNAILK